MPENLKDHLMDRAHERGITYQDLILLDQWIKSDPVAPEGPWFKDFGSFKICGEGELPKTF